VKSCDACQVDASTYCHYTAVGQAKCCERSIAQIPRSPISLEKLFAAITPVTENPIPSWASESDHCTKKRSCDACTDGQYCRYSFIGNPQCCEPAAKQQGVYSAEM
jgi:hypothetical protein